MNNVVAKSLREDHTDGDLGSILALLVFALGQVAIESMFDWPVSVADGSPAAFVTTCSVTRLGLAYSTKLVKSWASWLRHAV
jgi:hypothetical protein